MSDDKLDQYKQDIIKDADIVSSQRDRANEDMRFVSVPGGMWEGFLEDQFNDRTKLEFDIVFNYVNRFIGEWKQNRVGVEYKPDDSDTSDEDSELLNGIYRADFRQNSGKIATNKAVKEVSKCGYGCFKLATFFEDEGDPENDNQRIEWRVINNAYNTIYWDNAAKRIDKRDAKRCTELLQFTDDSFEEKWPDKTPSSAYTPHNRQLFNYERATSPIVHVGVRYEIVKNKETVYIYNDLASGKVEVYSEDDHELIKDELKKSEFKEFVRKRVVLKQHVEKTVFSGEEILEPTKRIAGQWIPIIAMYGYHEYIDGVEWYHGLVRKLMDAARLFNMQVSQLAENSASAGQEVPIFDPSQMKGGVGNIWTDKNNKPYLLARAMRDKDGNIIHQGPIGYSKPPQLDGNTAALMQTVPAFVQQTTGVFPQETVDPDASGKAIREMKKIENLNTQDINENISDAIEWSGVVYQSMAADGIYTRKRIVTTIGLDGTESQEQLLKTVSDEKTGKLVEANDLRGKKFRAYSDVGPQYDTLREQTVEELKGVAELLRDTPGGEKFIPAVIAMILDNMTGVGIGPLKKLVRQDLILQGLIPPKTDEEKQMLAQAQQPQPDPQQELIAAAAQQQQAEARNLDAASLEKASSAELKQAQTQKTIVEAQKLMADVQVNQQNAETNRIKTLADIRKEVFEGQQAVFQTVQGLPLQ